MCVSVLAGTHQGRGALSVLSIYICAAAQEELHHGNAAMAHREHERRLACLGRESEKEREFEFNSERVGVRGEGLRNNWRETQGRDEVGKRSKENKIRKRKGGNRFSLTVIHFYKFLQRYQLNSVTGFLL